MTDPRKTLRYVRDQLAADLQLMVAQKLPAADLVRRIVDTVSYIENCSDEEFEILSQDVP